MSADNAILVISFNDKEWLAKHVQAIDNLYWQWNSPKNTSTGIVYQRLYEMMKDAKKFESRFEALEYTDRLSENIRYLEYGIINLPVRFGSWKDMVDFSVKEIQEEIRYMKEEYIGNNKDIFIQGLEETMNIMNQEIQERK
jgi:hypothetical protein